MKILDPHLSKQKSGLARKWEEDLLDMFTKDLVQDVPKVHGLGPNVDKDKGRKRLPRSLVENWILDLDNGAWTRTNLTKV